MKFEELTGRVSSHLEEYSENNQIFLIDKETLNAYLALKNELSKDEIDLCLVSSHRSYESQLAIWNAKTNGERKLYDRNENLLDISQLSKTQLIESIMIWSALPGASRHHWGTEIDIFDAKIKTKSEVNLTISECESDFHHLYSILDSKIQDYGLYRPYNMDLGGVSREPWHLSFYKKSNQYFENYTFDVFLKSLEKSPTLNLKDMIIENADYLFKQFIQNICKK